MKQCNPVSNELNKHIYIYIYRRLGGVSSPLGRHPRNREIVSFRACERRAVSGCEGDSK